jgi:Fe-S cluster assembly protein SufD
MTAVSEQTGVWLEEFTRQHAAAPWVQKLRDSAFEQFAKLGFPTTRDEEWRFTNVAPIARMRFESTPGPVSVSEEAQPYLGQFARTEKNAFVALNTAFLNQVAFFQVPRNVVQEQPITIEYGMTHPGQPKVAHPRTLVVVGAGAHCTIIEKYQGSGAYFHNAVTEIVLGDGAVVDHYKLQQESTQAFHVSTMQVSLGRSASFTSHSIGLGGALVRNDANATLSEGSEGTLNGLYLVNGKQHIDNHTEIDHAKPHGTSHELYKGILDGQATAVFNGRIIVRQDAQKTDSKQTNKNLVLSDESVIHTKPELQIFADDVRCTHGATIGQLDEEALFYLQSRGIGKGEARGLLTYAFAQDILDRVKVSSLKDWLEKALIEKLHEHGK